LQYAIRNFFNPQRTLQLNLNLDYFMYLLFDIYLLFAWFVIDISLYILNSVYMSYIIVINGPISKDKSKDEDQNIHQMYRIK
jgi:hypothetical protein